MWQVIHGDCLEVLPTLGKVDAVVTDPPYGVSRSGSAIVRSDGVRNLDFFRDDRVEAPLEGLRLALEKLIRPGNFLTFCGHQQFGAIERMLTDAGMTTKPYAWVKSCPPPSMPGARFGSGFEIAVYGFDSRSFFGDPDAALRPNFWTGDSYRYGQPGKVDHPTQKPLRLMRLLARMLCPRGHTILDPFCGSGSTGVAALQEGMNFIGIEKEAKYVEIARRRIGAEAAQGKLGFA